MDLKDVTDNLSDQYNYRIQQRMEELMRTNPSYRNLDHKNRELIMDLIHKYKEKIRKGIKPSRFTVKEDKYYLFHNRIKLGLSYSDLEQFNDLLDSFKE